MTVYKTTDERLEDFFQKPINDIVSDIQTQEYEWGNSVGEELN